MRAENIISDPIKNAYKYTVYSVFTFIGVSLAAFIVWSLSCFGGAAYDLVAKLM